MVLGKKFGLGFDELVVCCLGEYIFEGFMY